MEPNGRGAKRRLVEVKDRMVYVPILQTLQVLLHYHVIDGHKDEPGYLSDFCDGEEFSQNRLFSSHCRAIQIMFYYDYLEVANPLGSKRTKHKLGKYTIIIVS